MDLLGLGSYGDDSDDDRQPLPNGKRTRQNSIDDTLILGVETSGASTRSVARIEGTAHGNEASFTSKRLDAKFPVPEDDSTNFRENLQATIDAK
jgi:hypothetical protein